MIKELDKGIKGKVEELIISIADQHMVGKPAILATGLFFSVEKLLLEQINKIEDTFAD